MDGFGAAMGLAVAGVLLVIFGTLGISMVYMEDVDGAEKSRKIHRAVTFILILAAFMIAPALVRLVILAVLS